MVIVKCTNPACSAILPAGMSVCPACGTVLTSRAPASTPKSQRLAEPEPAPIDRTEVIAEPTPNVGIRSEPLPDPAPQRTPATVSPGTARRSAAPAVSGLIRIGLWVVVLFVLLGFAGWAIGPRSTLATQTVAWIIIFGGLGVWGIVMRLLPIGYRRGTRTVTAGGLHRRASWYVGRAAGVRKTGGPVAALILDEFAVTDSTGTRPFQVRGLNMSLQENDTLVVGYLGKRPLFYHVARVDLSYAQLQQTPWRRLVRGVRGTPFFLWLALLNALLLLYLVSFPSAWSAPSTTPLPVDTMTASVIAVSVVVALIACPITRAINNRRVWRTVSSVAADALGGR